MNFLAATHSKDLEYCFLFSFLIEAFLLQPFCPLCESIHTTEAYRIFLITRTLEQGKVISVGILNILFVVVDFFSQTPVMLKLW